MKAAGMLGGEAGQYQTCMERGGADNKTLVCGIDVGEIRKSSDEGTTWTFPRMEGLRAGGISSVLVHPTDAKIIYAYGNWINYKASSLSGVFKTTDGGDTWTRVLEIPNTAGDVSCSHHQIEFDPAAPTKLYCGAYNQGFYISTDSGSSWIKRTNFPNKKVRWVRVKNSIILVGCDEGEIWRSTDDGVNWTLSTGISSGANISALVFHPTDTTGMTVYAVRSGDMLYKSTNGGVSFSSVAGTNKTGVALFDISPANPQYMYLMSTDGRYIYYSHNGDGGPWNQSTILNNNLTFIGSLGNWIGNASTGMSCSPTDANKAVVSIGTRIYKTSDGGVTYTPSNNGNPGFAHGWGCDPGMFFDKINPAKMWMFCLDFGTVGTVDGWDTATRYGGDDTYFEDGTEWGSNQFGGVVLPSGRIIAIGGEYFNNTIKATDDGNIWRIVDKDTLTLQPTGPDGPGAPYPVKLNYAETIQLHPQNNNVIYCSNLRSDDGGNTWHKMADGSYHILGMYRKNGDIIYAKKYTDWTQRKQGGVIYKSTNKGDTWTALPDAGVDIGYVWHGPAGFAVDPIKEDRFYTLSSNHVYSIYRFDSGTWTEIIPKPNREPKSIAIDPNNPRIIYVSLDGKGEPSVYKSEDYGNTWVDIQYNLPMVGAGTLVVNPHDSSLYYNSGIGTWRLSKDSIFQPPSSLINVRVYPNPYNPKVGTVKLDSIPINCVISIFNVSGDLINTINEVDFGNLGYVEWDGRNKTGQMVSRGIYIFVVQDTNGNKKTGKIAVVY